MSSNSYGKLFYLLAYVAITAILFLGILAVNHSAVVTIHNSLLSGCTRGNALRALLNAAFHAHPAFPPVDCVTAYPSP